VNRPRSPQRVAALPTRDEILAFVASQPGEVDRAKIVRAFGLKHGADRHAIRPLLKQLGKEGHIRWGGKKKRTVPGTLPKLVLAEVGERDSDGELIATPTEWDEEAHGPPPKIRLERLRRTRPREIAGVGDRAMVRVEPTDDADDPVRYTGRVVRIAEPATARIYGIFRAMHDGSGRLIPADKKQMGRQLVIPPADCGEAQDGEFVAVEVIVNRKSFGTTRGRVKKRYGSIKDESTVSLIAIAAHGIRDMFPHHVVKEADAARPAELAGREDWRDVPLVTIDPADAKDHDDAVHAEADTDPANPGGHVMRIAIADVAHYVRPGSGLDREALIRGNSVYFPDRVVPMLPERISNDLCSLRPHEARAALAVRIVIGADGRKRSHTFHRVLMRSTAKLSYQQTQRAMDGWPDETTGPLLASVLEPLYSAYRVLKHARDARGPLDLDLPERKIVLTAHATVDRVVTPERLDAHRLIEEFMILANVAAAETLERAKVPLIYRVHDEPDIERVNALREFLKTLDISLPKAGALRAEQFNGILARVKGRDVEKLVNELVLRTQAQAEYAAENYGHFGLNLRRYAHFTSPIRRYADLVVHRGLIRVLKLGDGALPEGTDIAALSEVAAAISATERRAMKAERETFDRLIANFLADRVGATFEGHIAGATRSGLFIKLDDTGADGFVPARTIGADYFQYQEDRHAMVGQSSGETYRLGDPVTVRLVETAPVAGALRFEILSAGSAGKRPPPERRARTTSREKQPARKRRK